MGTPKNIQIPYDDFLSLLDVMDYIDIRNYDESFKRQFELIFDVLKDKKKKLELRESYSVVVNSKTDDARDLARVEYLRKKNSL